MTTRQLAAQIWLHVSATEACDSPEAMRYRLNEIKRLALAELNDPFIVDRPNEKASGAEPLA